MIQYLINYAKLRVSALRDDESGAALVEYAAILGLLLAVTVGTLTTIGTDVNTIFTAVMNFMNTAAG
jgi:Flp pilus assembly pilin Flp